MTRVVRNRRAIADLRTVWRYVAGDDETAADNLVRRIEDRIQRLAENPRMGQAQPSYGRDIRSFTVGHYILFYRPLDDGIQLIRVLHGARDVARLLGDR